MDIRTISVDKYGHVTMASPRKTIIQFSHNAVVYQINVPKSIVFNSAFVVYKNEYADARTSVPVSINTDYISETLTQILFPVVQPMTDEYGRLDCWLVLKNGDIQIMYSDAIYLYIQQSNVIVNGTVPLDIADTLQGEIGDNAQDIVLIKQQLIDASTGDVIVITFEGSSGSGRKQIFNDSNVNSYAHEEDDLWFHASVVHSISSSLTHCTLSGPSSVEEGTSYSGVISPEANYSITSVTVTMGGIAGDYYSNGVITIPSVTGDVVITAIAELQLYTTLEYLTIHNDSTNGYKNGIDTGLALSGANKIEFKISSTDSGGQFLIIASLSGSSINSPYVSTINSLTLGGTGYTSCTLSSTPKLTELKDGTARTITMDYSSSSSMKLYFGSWIDFNFSRTINWYSFKVWNGETLMRDLIPVKRNEDDVYGMLDLVNNVFYTNAGTGTFTGN